MPDARSAGEHPLQPRSSQPGGADVDVHDQLQLLYNACPDAVVMIDADGVIAFANHAVAETFGWEPAEIIGRELAVLQPERLRAAHRDGLRRYLASGERKLDWRATRIVGLHRDGHEFPIEIAFTDLGGGRFGGFIRDISGRVAADEALHASELRYRELVDNANDLIYAYDLEGRIMYANLAATRLYGYAQEEVLGLNIWNIVDVGHLARAAERVEKLVQGGSSEGPHVLLTRNRAGDEIWIEANVRVIRDEGGQPVGMHGIARDISARKQAEEALARTRDFRDRVMESTTNAIAASDLQGRFTLANRRMCEMTGYGMDELLGEPFSKLFSGAALELAQGSFASAASGDAVDDLELELVRKDRSAVAICLSLRPLMEDGAVAGVVGIAEDITERKRGESLIAAQRQLLEIVAVGAPLSEVLDSVARTVESLLPGALCSILLVDRESQTLRTGAAPSLPASYTQAVDGVAIGPDVGPCGTAVHRNACAIVRDIAEEQLWVDFKDLALAHGLRSCWSSPIAGDSGSVLGAFAIYRRAPHEPLEFERELVGVVTHIAGIAIERQRSAEAVRARAAELERISTELMLANDDLAGQRGLLEEKSARLEAALVSERERSSRDALTGALNHAAIAEEARKLIERPESGSLALAMIDVDGLKAVNDLYGHQMGDAVLLAVASALRRDGAIVGRYGGDEFIAILPDADRAAATAYRQQVADVLTSVDLRDGDTGSRIQIGVSVGLAIYPEEADAVEDLIKLSDSAMYASRRQRAEDTASTAFARVQGGDRAAELVGEIVPFLTSPGDLDTKLSLVAERLSLGAGYDAVNFSLYDARAEGLSRTASFSVESRIAAKEYDEESTRNDEPTLRMRKLLESTRRPIVIDDLQDTEFATSAQKDLFRTVGLLSALVAPMIWRGEVIGMVSVASKQPAAFGPRDAQFLSAIATQVTAIVRTAALVDDLQSASDRLLHAHTETVVMLAAAAEAHDDTTGRHLQRVREIAQALAAELGHDEVSAKEIGLAAVLHDIGKIRVPDYVLASSASLSDSEWKLMKDHTVWGSEFLGSRGGFELAMLVARSHHERWDGSGYPDGLAGDLIPEAAAITSVADSMDAMINNRPYRAGRPLADAVLEIQAWSGRQFSPRIVEALVALHQRGELAHLQASDEHDQLAA